MRRLDPRRFLRQRLDPLALMLAGAMVLLGHGCSSKQGVVAPAPAGESGIRIEQGNVVRWTTELPARGSVRYGFSPGDYDHVAYPVAAQQADRALVREHAVPLLDLRQGATVYYQVQSQL
jgi:hypothetical protein